MSDIVGGGISRGRGNSQVTIEFVGKLKPAEWDAFVRCVVQCAEQAGVQVNEVNVTTLTRALTKSNP